MLRRRLSWVWSCVLVAGCWSSEPLVLDTFTADQWSRLRHDLDIRVIEVEPCTLPDVTLDPMRCETAAELGQALFFEPQLSADSQVACATCHDTRNGFADTRPENNVSLAALGTYTKRNAIATLNAGEKEVLSPDDPPFGWTGVFKRADGSAEPLLQASDVVDLAMAAALKTPPGKVKRVIAAQADYRVLYERVFPPIEAASDEQVVENFKVVIEVYLRRLHSAGSKFDSFIAGNLDAFSDSEQRGFVVFTTRGMCIECHRGPLLTDFKLHNTGVPQVGLHVVDDSGHAGTGAFLTPSLRDVTLTHPYMHDGAFGTLREVIDFYNAGGGDQHFAGTKDATLVPLELDGRDIEDLEAFLGTLEGQELPDWLTADTHANRCFSPEQTQCWNGCFDLESDPQNCGRCDLKCAASMVCSMGQCVLPAGRM